MIYTMPRSHSSANQWRALFAAISIALILCIGFQASAQKKKKRGKTTAQTATQQTDSNSNAATTTSAPQPQKKNLAPLRGSDSPEGGRATITSDAPLNDYEAYRSGNRYYVVIPQANAPGGASNLRGRGFDDVQVHKRGNDTVLSFRLKPGATAHVNQKFNRLEVVFNTPGDATSGTTAGATPSGTTGAQTANGNTNTSRPGTTTAGANTNASATPTPSGTTSSSTGATVAASPSASASPGTALLPPITPGLGPTVESSPTPAQPSPTVEQIAQAQPAPSVPTAVTTTPPIATGTSLGTVLKNNWLMVLIAALLLISIGLVAMTRSRSRRSATEARPIGDRETPALEEGTIAKAEAARLDEAAVAGAVAAVKTSDREAATLKPAALMDETETLEAEPVEALDVERVRLEIKHVLTGQEYDEAIINTPVKETRQLIESELLFALSKRHTDRRDRALKAFTDHGYFDDATRDLRTADSPAERAAAARKLGLTRDAVATPHLVAALEDTAPEVRRAAIEALTELRDPASVGPLESLLEREEDRKVPHALIQRAIKASAAGVAAVQAQKPAATTVEPALNEETLAVEDVPAVTEEVAPPVAEAEAASPIAEAATLTEEALMPGVVAESLTSAPASRDEAIQDQRIEAEPVIEAEPASLQGADITPVEAATEASTPALSIESAVVEGIVTAEASAAERHRAKADAERLHAETERVRVEEEARRREAEERQRVEAEAQRQRVEAEAERRQAEAEAERQRVEAEAERHRAEEERQRAEEESRRQAEEERRRAAEQVRLEEQARLKAAEEERLRAEEARRLRAEERERRRAEEEKARIEEHEERERVEADAARRRAEEAALRLAEMRRHAEEEARQREEAEAARLQSEEEARRAEEEAERQRVENEEAEARQREEEALERQRAEEARLKEEAEERQRVEAEAQQQRVEAEAQRQRAEAERRQAKAEAERQRVEAEAERRRAEEERQRAEEESRRQAEEERRRAEEERQRAEAEAARIQFEQEAEERRRREEAEAATYARTEEVEPGYTDAATPTEQPELFELTLDPEQSATVSAHETSTEIVEHSASNDWMSVDYNEAEVVRDVEPVVTASPFVADESAIVEHAGTEETLEVKGVEEAAPVSEVKEIELAGINRGAAHVEDDFASVPGGILRRLGSEIASERAAAVSDLVRIGGDDSFREISAAFDDPAQLVRDAAARALFDLNDDHASSFTRALREAPPDRRRRIGNALASSGLANKAIGHLMGESREKTYDAFSLLFLMSKAGEVQPLMRAIEEHPNSEVRLAVVKLLALSGQQDILPAFRRLAVRGSLPTEVRSAVMEAIYQISSQASSDTTPVA
jgi:hypothetical protein